MKQISIFKIILTFIVIIISFLSGCATHGRVLIEGENGSVIIEKSRRGGNYKSAPPNIPRGHMPPPGKCRVWLPGVPPGQQPPPGDCQILRHRVPQGAWLIHGVDKKKGKHK